MPKRSDPENVFKVTTPNDREIVMKRTFDAPRTKVFEAWTKTEHVAHWWDPTGVPLAACEIDLRQGGAFRWVHGGPGGQGHVFAGTYREIVPPEKLVFSVQMFPSSPAPIGTLVLAEDGNTTDLTLTIACATKEDRDALLRMRVDAGTAKTLENLDAFLHKMV